MHAQESHWGGSTNLFNQRSCDGGASSIRLRFSGTRLPGSNGNWFSESDYPFVENAQLTLEYKGQLLESTYYPDFICFSDVVVELKALSRTGGIEEAQVINYLKALDTRLGY